jgi:glutathione S-transferase
LFEAMPMLILRSSPASPFGRKVKIAALELGLMDRIEIVAADTNDPAEPLRRQNPLGKIPTLVLEDGTTLFDSRVIVDYLDHIAGGGRLIPTGDERFAQLRLQALADGLCDAALLQVYEIRFRPEEGRNAAWVANQAGKVERALAALEAAPPTRGRAWLSRPSLCRHLARQPSAPRRLARHLRRQGPGFRGDPVQGLNSPIVASFTQQKTRWPKPPGP